LLCCVLSMLKGAVHDMNERERDRETLWLC
jgi:hypothetical protein